MSPLWDRRAWTPTARTAEVVVEELGDELVVYDQRSDQVHCLGAVARRVWRGCDGKTSADQLSKTLKLDSEVVDRALGELDACDLFDGEATDGVTRREAAASFAKIGAAAAAAPLIYSIAAPPPAMALTACGTGQFGCLAARSTSNACPDVTTCRTGGCACCYLSPNQCGGMNFGACATPRTCSGSSNPCTVAYVKSTCGTQANVCTGTKIGCTT